MSQIRQNVALYSRVELLLKKAMRENNPLPVSDIVKLVGDVAKDGKQTTNVVNALYAKGLLHRSDYKVPGTRERYRYAWDPVMSDEGFATKAEKPVTKPTPTKQVMVAKPADEIELQIGGVSIIVGKNPMTGRIKVVIEG